MNILTEIVENRRKLIQQKGYELGIPVPEKRIVPLNSFIQDPFLVCEVKRKSPSKGNISIHLDAYKQAELYYSKGIRSVSVLTETSYFAGSLSDLMSVKQGFPDLAVLRKDFLVALPDIDVSYRAGADAVLLIAAILTTEELSCMYNRAKDLGMEVLVEVHTKEDVEKAKYVRPSLTGINSRDLVNFRVDLTIPLEIKQMITWNTNFLFESGIHFKEDALVALSSGFRGLLVGEAVVRDPDLIDRLIKAFSLKRRNFWERLYKRKKPYVKICGITCIEDADYAQKCGADILGFVFAPSRRRAELSLLPKLDKYKILKVGVVVTNNGSKTLDSDIKQLLDNGHIDTIQFHGDEEPDECFSLAFPYYKALQIKEKKDIERIGEYHCPRVLVDAFSSGKIRGGTGKSIPDYYITMIQNRFPLWLAGGLGPENIGSVMKRFSPELVDASSRLEKSPGKKNPEFVARFIKQVKGQWIVG